MNQAINQKIASWLEGNFDAATKDEIRSLQANQPDLLEDAFYRNLEFGTGGLRGLMGVGTNRVNKYTIGMATQGFSNYLLKTYPNESISVLQDSSATIGEVNKSNKSKKLIKDFVFIYCTFAYLIFLCQASNHVP